MAETLNNVSELYFLRISEEDAKTNVSAMLKYIEERREALYAGESVWIVKDWGSSGFKRIDYHYKGDLEPAAYILEDLESHACQSFLIKPEADPPEQDITPRLKKEDRETSQKRLQKTVRNLIGDCDPDS